MGDVGNGDDAYHNGAFYLAANFGFYTQLQAARRAAAAAARRRASISAPPDRYDFFLRMGPLANAMPLPEGQERYWNDS